MSCIFCELSDYVLENDLAYAIFDKFPATKGHMLVIPKRHVANFFDITKEEGEAIFDLVRKCLMKNTIQMDIMWE